MKMVQPEKLKKARAVVQKLLTRNRFIQIVAEVAERARQREHGDGRGTGSFKSWRKGKPPGSEPMKTVSFRL